MAQVVANKYLFFIYTIFSKIFLAISIDRKMLLLLKLTIQ